MIKKNSLAAGAALVVLALASAACAKHAAYVRTDEEAPQFSSMLRMSDPRVQQQLTSGFYGIESGAWRWTAGKFSIVVRPPAGADTKGAKLDLKLFIPDPVIKQLNSTTLYAKVGDTSLEPKSFDKVGDYDYNRDVPAMAFQGKKTVRVDFWLDRSIPATAADHRELGIVVKQVGLEPRG